MSKTIHEDEMHTVTEWECPYVRCGHNNIIDGEPYWTDEVTCYKCKKTIKISHDYE